MQNTPTLQAHPDIWVDKPEYIEDLHGWVAAVVEVDMDCGRGPSRAVRPLRRDKIPALLAAEMIRQVARRAEAQGLFDSVVVEAFEDAPALRCYRKGGSILLPLGILFRGMLVEVEGLWLALERGGEYLL